MDPQKERLIALLDEKEANEDLVFKIYNPLDCGEKPRKPLHCEREIGVRTEPKISRNDPCPCGSTKKYKHCCLGKPAHQPIYNGRSEMDTSTFFPDFLMPGVSK